MLYRSHAVLPSNPSAHGYERYCVRSLLSPTQQTTIWLQEIQIANLFQIPSPQDL